MALVVEDGTGLSNAESYASVETADSVIAAFGASPSWAALATGTKEQALRAATMWLDGTFSTRFSGIRLYQGQALEWPRGFASYATGMPMSSTAVPTAVVRACCLAAAEHVTSSAFSQQVELASESVGLGSGALSKSVTFATPKAAGFVPAAALLALRPVLTAPSMERA